MLPPMAPYVLTPSYIGDKLFTQYQERQHCTAYYSDHTHEVRGRVIYGLLGWGVGRQT